MTTSFYSYLNGIFKGLLQNHRIDFTDHPGAVYGGGEDKGGCDMAVMFYTKMVTINDTMTGTRDAIGIVWYPWKVESSLSRSYLESR